MLLLRKRQPGWWDDDGVGGGQCVARQVVVGNDYAHAQPLGLGDARHAGDAVVDGDEQVGLPESAMSGGKARYFGREAVAGLEAVRYQIVHRGAHRPQRAQADGTGGGAVAIVIGDDEDFLLCGNGIG
jgi:hypothetical protein